MIEILYVYYIKIGFATGCNYILRIQVETNTTLFEFEKWNKSIFARFEEIKSILINRITSVHENPLTIL